MQYGKFCSAGRAWASPYISSARRRRRSSSCGMVSCCGASFFEPKTNVQYKCVRHCDVLHVGGHGACSALGWIGSLGPDSWVTAFPSSFPVVFRSFGATACVQAAVWGHKFVCRLYVWYFFASTSSITSYCFYSGSFLLFVCVAGSCVRGNFRSSRTCRIFSWRGWTLSTILCRKGVPIGLGCQRPVSGRPAFLQAGRWLS